MSDRMSDPRLATSAAVLLLAPAMLLVTGCGYMVGAPYESDVRTVHVPTFTSDSFRRGLEFQLTEAVQKQIQSRTPFRLAKEPYADTRLTGNIALIRKSPLGESAFDDVRELQVSFAVEVTWEDLRTGQILTQQRVPIAPEVVHLVSEAEFAPEVGQSLASANQQAMDRMARHIVEMMEMPW